MTNTVEENKRLVEKYPFLLPRNRWTGLAPEKYDYSYTELDAMPTGWRIAFGEKMCEEIKAELEASGYLNEYRIEEIKEKYGSLRWYDFGAPERILKEIVPKYEDISIRTCIKCGSPAKYITEGYILPYCENCVPKNSRTHLVKDNYI